MHARFSILLLCGLLAPANASAAPFPELRVRRFTVDNGLSQSDVADIVRDRQGFLWIATQDGLNRFDGYSFVVHRHSAQDPESISDNAIWALAAAKDGSLWIGTFAGGLNRYDPITGHFKRFLHDASREGSISWNNVTSVVEDLHGSIWAGTWGGGLNRLDRATGTFTRFQHDPADTTTLPGNRIYSLAATPSGRIWVGAWDGLSLFDPQTRTAKRFPRPVPGGRSLTEIQTLLPEGDSVLWVGTQQNGLFRVRVEGRTVTPIPLPREEGKAPLSVRALMIGPDATLWIGTGGEGVIRRDLRAGVMSVSGNNPADVRSIGYDAVNVLYRQDDGLVWIGTGGAGVNLYDPRHETFELLSVHRPAAAPLSHNLARAFVEDDRGRLWVGTSGGGITVLEPDRSSARTFGTEGDAQSGFAGKYVHALARDEKGTIWAGTGNEGLWRADSRTGRFIRMPRSANDPGASKFIGALAVSPDGALWIGSMGDGLERRDPATGGVTRWRRRTGDSTSLSGDYVYSLLVASTGEVWVGTWGQGLSRLDPRTGTFRRYLYTPSDPHALPANTVQAIHEDKEGRIWVGTAGGGLAMLDRATGRFRVFAEKDGLPNGVVHGALSDPEGRIWVSTNHGIARVDPASGKVRSFDAADGLQGNEFNLGAAYAGRDGRFYFGGVNGVTVFNPKDVAVDPSNPPVVLTSFRVFDRPVHLDTLISSTREIVLDYPQNFFSFEFSALAFSAPEKVRYAYRMEGVDRDWVPSVGRRYASYTNLDPGLYLFRVRGANRDGVWSTADASVRVVITAPFWMSWWFRLLALLTGTAAVTLVVWQRIRSERREKQSREEFSRGLLQSEERERSRIAGELHDSLMQSLLIAKNRALLALRHPEDHEKLRNGLDEIAGVMTGALDEVRRIAHNLRPYQLDRLGLTKALQSLASAAGESAGVRFTAELDELDTAFSRDQAILVYRVVQEAVNNILKHSAATEAHIRAERGTGEVLITVRDNGRGLGTAGKAPRDLGFGMSGIAERIRMLGGTMTVEGSQGRGTTLLFRVPERREE